MKKLALLFVFSFITFVGFSQTDGISYQAVIIDNNPQEIPGVDIPSNNLPNVPLQVQFSIIDNNGSLEYQENHNTTTDAYGMIHLMIGHGQPTVNTFNQIYWNNDKFLKVEIDLNDGNGWVEFSYQELTYIPYVKHREIIATSTLDVDGETNLNNNFNVNNASPSHLTGDLTVDGNTNLNGALTVFNQEPTLLTGDLTVEGLVSFDGELAVGGDTNLYSDLTVEGNTQLNGDLTVVGQANFNDGNFQNITVAQNSNLNLLDVSGVSNLNNTLNVNGISNLNSSLNVLGISTLSSTLNVNASSNLSGRVLIDYEAPDIGDLNPSSYPLWIKGSKQGIEIELNGNGSGGTPNNSNNFVSFSGANNNRYGRIEGQTTSELTSSFVFVWYATQASLQTAFQLAMVVVDLIGVDDGDAAIVEGVEMVDAIANWAGYNLYSLDNVGVSFSSGFGDYAEWLEKRDLNEKFSYGDIVGVIGGKITKNTESANHYMVISQNPIVLGNMQQDTEQPNFEKVAFMGQVPVKVLGAVQIGDYIVPSGLHDGIGRAISPKDLGISDYEKIVGVAWSSSDNQGLSMINLAVGINTNDTNQILKQQQQEINQLKNQISEILNYINNQDPSFKTSLNTNDKKVSMRNSNVAITNNETSVSGSGQRIANKNSNNISLNQQPVKNSSVYQRILIMIDDNPKVLQDIQANARDLMDAKGIDYKLYEQTNLLLTDKDYFLDYLRELIKN